MKKFKNIKLMLIGLFAMVGMNAFAQDNLTNGTLKFVLEGGKATITGFADGKKAEDVVIEEKITNIADGKSYEVGKIAKDAFKNAGVKTLDIEKCKIADLTADMFTGMKSLTSIKLGGNVKTIAEGAFAETSIKDLNLSKTKVVKINNLFGSNQAYEKEAVTLTTPTDVYEANKELAQALTGSSYAKGDKAGADVYYTAEEAAAYNENLKGAIHAGDDLPYTKASANDYNKAVFPAKGFKNTDDQVFYTADDAAEFNAALPEALEANKELSAKDALLYSQFVDALLPAQLTRAINLYNLSLPGAYLVDESLTANETWSYEMDAYDWNLAYFEPQFKEQFFYSATYSNLEAETYNIENAGKTGFVAVNAGDKKLAAYFNSNKEADDYNIEHGTSFAKGDMRPNFKPTPGSANVANETALGAFIAKKGDVRTYYIPADAEAAVITDDLPGAFDPTVSADVDAYKELTRKHAGDKLSDNEAVAYNEALPGAMKETAPGVWTNPETGKTFPTDAEGNPIYYTTEDAYEYNQALIAAHPAWIGCAVAGNKTGTKATAETAADYNATLEGHKTTADVKDKAELTEAEANTKNEALITGKGKTPYSLTAPNNVVKAEKKAAVLFTALEQVELPAAWEEIAEKSVKGSSHVIGAFEGCSKLATVDFGGNPATKKQDLESTKTVTVGDNAFLGTALTAIDLSKTFVDAIPANLIVDGSIVTTNSSLTTVTLNPFITSIPGGIFADCTALTTVTFPKDAQQLTEDEKKLGVLDDYSKTVLVDEYDPSKYFYPSFVSIGAKAFANTAIASFRLPATYTVGEVVFDIIDTEEGSSNVPCVDASAFSGCKKLTEFTYLPNSVTPDQEVDDMAFPGCKGIIFKTTHAYMTTNEDAPKNSKYELFVAGYQTEFVTYEFKKTPGKYYIKYYATKNIRVKKDEAKVYNAYLDAADYTLNMCLYKAQGGYYEIAPGATVLIITNNKNLQFEDGTGLDGSWVSYESPEAAYAWAIGTGMTPAAAATYVDGLDEDEFNALKIVMNEDGIARTDLDAEAGAGMVVYGWVNSATAGTGFQKITTGDKFKAGTMYILAAEPAEDARLNVRWLDENGNVDSEATGIKTINTVNADSDEIFNLQGVRVNKAQKGLYIINGKKVVK